MCSICLCEHLSSAHGLKDCVHIFSLIDSNIAKLIDVHEGHRTHKQVPDLVELAKGLLRERDKARKGFELHIAKVKAFIARQTKTAMEGDVALNGLYERFARKVNQVQIHSLAPDAKRVKIETLKQEGNYLAALEESKWAAEGGLGCNNCEIEQIYSQLAKSVDEFSAMLGKANNELMENDRQVRQELEQRRKEAQEAMKNAEIESEKLCKSIHVEQERVLKCKKNVAEKEAENKILKDTIATLKHQFNVMDVAFKLESKNKADSLDKRQRQVTTPPEVIEKGNQIAREINGATGSLLRIECKYIRDITDDRAYCRRNGMGTAGVNSGQHEADSAVDECLWSDRFRCSSYWNRDSQEHNFEEA